MNSGWHFLRHWILGAHWEPLTLWVLGMNKRRYAGKQSLRCNQKYQFTRQPTTALQKMYSSCCLHLGFSFNTKWHRKLWRSRSSFRVTMRNLNWQLISVRHKSRKVLLSKSLNAPPLRSIRLNFSTFSKPLMCANYNKTVSQTRDITQLVLSTYQSNKTLSNVQHIFPFEFFHWIF